MARILVIEDDPHLRKAICETLESAGHTVAAAADGERGCATQKAFRARIVICDIFMPVQDGLETISQLRREHPDVKIIAMSGKRKTRHADYMKTAAELGAAGAIVKPFDAEQLIDEVSRMERL
jgi:DNA-binding response OmpR family regulator